MDKIDLKVEVDATDKDGIREVKLYLNGLLLKTKDKEQKIWSSLNDELLENLKAGIYCLKAVAEDKTGTLGWREIQITVGDVSKINTAQGNDEIYQVILNEGEMLMGEEIREFPRLECYLSLRDDGRLALNNGMPGKSNGLLWKAMMHNDHSPHHYATLKKGQLVIYRGTPEKQEAIPYKTPAILETGNYKLGITTSKRLVIFSEDDGQKQKIVWRSEILEPWRL